MVRIRCTLAAAVLVVLVALMGCGQQGEARSPAAVGGLDVLLEHAAIRGGAGITVRPLPVGTLRADEPLRSMVIVRADQKVSTRSLVLFRGLAERTGGGAGLGVTGLCGRGWTSDGDQVEEDHCAGANMAMSIGRGGSDTVQVFLYPATPSGTVGPGTFHIAIPFDDGDGPQLDLTYRIVERGQVDLPSWPAERVPLGISFEPNPVDVWPTLFVRIEDGYGRIIDERDLSAYKDDHPDLENDGVFTVDVPRGLPMTVRLFRRDGHDWVPCGTASAFVTARGRWPMTLVDDTCRVA